MMKYLETNLLGLFWFFFFFFNVITALYLSDDCKPSRCGNKGPVVRFPFRLKGKQPDHCGYPEKWFDLYCSEKNDTILQMTPSWKLTINHINYSTQYISAFDSETRCLAKTLLNFNHSLSPFMFLAPESHTDDYTLINCSSKVAEENSDAYFPVSCLSLDSHYKVYAIFSRFSSFYYRDFLSCFKMRNILEVPPEYLRTHQKTLDLLWSYPDCTSCEAKGELCGLTANSNSNKIVCYGKHKPGSSTKFIATGVTFGSILLAGAVFLLYRLYRYSKAEIEYQLKFEKFLDDYRSFKPTRFSYAHIKRMTNRFKHELGQGAFGTVYRGELSDDILVAVKLLNNSTANGDEFINEVGTIGRIHHVNVVRLIGFCAEGFRRALVYEYMPNDSLHKFISSADSNKHFLGWKRLQDISIGVAKGIDYLHQGCNQRILHFDIKPQNILLDHDFHPKVSDFGLAKLCAKDQSIVSMTTAKGTIGYMAPEVFSRNFGNVSFKSDVYSFGMLVLEMVGGRKIVNEKDDQVYFPEWIYNLLEEGEDLRLEIGEEEDAVIAKKLAIVGLWCIQWNPTDRPSMKTVIQMLEDKRDDLPIPPNPFSSARRSAKRPERHIPLELEVIPEVE